MDEYISRQAAIDGKISIQRANGVEIYTDEAVPVEYLKNVPAADVVPVVRCKYCRYRVDPDKCCYPDGLLRRKNDDFCSYGERREG